jgi:riboflavin kinase / FMN adenylyltransferase
MKRLIAIGNFDGVHRGHQHLLSAVVEQARALGLVPTVLTFDPHPSVVLGRSGLPLLTRIETKVKLLKQVSSDLDVVVHPFTRELAALSPDGFVRDVLVGRYGAGHVVVGSNFRFGAGRAGNLQSLQSLGREHGFSAEALPLLEGGGQPISSSRIRALLAGGDVDAAAVLLGRPHVTIGEVVHGDAIGRTIGFPTANLDRIAELVPGFGVYACRVNILGQPEQQTLLAASSIGVRPTLDQSGPPPVRVEVHVLDRELDLYGRPLAVSWVSRLRGEERFPSLDALKAQIASDVDHARRILG